ncbi:MAG: hypothetical protein JO112_20120 [Planctomycetes bacterium]|nr:hypothetical protein [Planctomycetota bacterium]
MTEAWNILSSILEARPRSKGPLGDLLSYISDRYGEHDADELKDFVDRAGSYDEVRKHVALKYMDDKADGLVKGLSTLIGRDQGSSTRSQSQGGGSSAPNLGGRSQDKGSGPSEPIPSRPDRRPDAGSQLTTPSKTSGQHAMGSAGSHQKPQSYAMRPGVAPTSSKELGAEPAHTRVQKPSKPGDFIGQQWQPAAYSAPEKNKESDEVGEVERAIDKELSQPRPDMERVKTLQAKLGILQRRSGGFRMRSIQHGAQATGQMQRGAVAQNPAKPGSVVRRSDGKTVRWTDEHPGWYWAGPEHGWVSKSQFVSLVGSGQVKTSRH